LPVLALAAGMLALATRSAVGQEPGQFEEHMLQRNVDRVTQRTFQHTRTERAMWVKVLESAYPDKMTEKLAKASTDEEYGAWFDLLAGKNGEWRKDDSPNQFITQLFEMTAGRLELGPVPSIKRDEFIKSIKRSGIAQQAPPAKDPPELNFNDDADKVFRVLDKDADGELDPEELTTGLKEDKVKADPDNNGRISKEEYRAYFKQRVEAKAAAQMAQWAAWDPFAPPEKKGARTKNFKADKGGDAIGSDGMPEWFALLDTDKDKQVSLFEWRDGNRPTEVFREMDLDGDGLLTKDEYLRYRKKKEIELDQKRREEGK
jgi:Ca2+-binding EF-hand superfamily protein